MEIIKEYGEFYKDIIKMNINCIADEGELFFSIPGVDVTENNRIEIYKKCIEKINDFYDITITSLNTFVEDGVVYIKIVTQ